MYCPLTGKLRLQAKNVEQNGIGLITEESEKGSDKNEVDIDIDIVSAAQLLNGEREGFEERKLGRREWVAISQNLS